MSRYRFIDRRRDRVPVRELCAVLLVATSSTAPSGSASSSPPLRGSRRLCGP